MTTTRWLSAAGLRDLVGADRLRSPAYRDLAERIRFLVVDGRLAVGTRLPSERELARTLALSRSTVTAAYAHLGTAGYLRSRQGAGNFVVVPPGRALGGLPGVGLADAGTLNLTFGAPAAPAGVAEAYAGAVEQLPGLLRSHGYSADGLPVLRERIAAWYGARGLPTDPAQVVVTSGALAALNVVAAALLGPGDRVLVEAPSYGNALEALRRRGARLLPYPLGPDGWDPAGFDATVRQTAPRAAYLIPEFHNPTGHWMAEEVRPELAGSLRRNRTVAVVDETLVEVRLDGQPPRLPLAAHLPDAVTLGSASKAFWGGLRVGWLRAPRDLVRTLVENRATLDLGTAPLEQLAVAGLLEDPGPVLADQRRRLREQRDRLVQQLAEHLPGWRCRVPAGGLSLWLELPTESSSRLAAAAERQGLLLTAGPRSYPGAGGERRVRLPFAAAPEVLDDAVQRLVRAWSAVEDAGTSAPSLPPLELSA
ncbi:DNA-binding transcriptional regulator, MocR family, contains an aminotransferase domain [Friedmanniella luteola]|uniref:DNA-binding transcriptional regulator, MocR family, contains an aminotransferase domain n=1 Tax=Friedmanniella luteola TaxID=546871 RepID=A0A1H1TYV5_9ACTN|nr:PLP-dependent aminotransferase family protein [Friedmanniella luteola]SDS64779.1 DNA-binding transcriptional regulator, MocR family, contains an aminotransferase domain [Friedmanniella luteola]